MRDCQRRRVFVRTTFPANGGYLQMEGCTIVSCLWQSNSLQSLSIGLGSKVLVRGGLKLIILVSQIRNQIQITIRKFHLSWPSS